MPQQTVGLSQTSAEPLTPVPAPLLLVVEDDPGDALLVEELLADSDLVAELRCVGSLAAARRALAHEAPQCVLLDLHLPDAVGLAALRGVLSAAPGAAVVVLTGQVEQQAGLAAVAAGAQDYLVKGRVDPELFGRAIRYAIQRKQAEQAATALQAQQLRAEENARLERGLLPVPLLAGAPLTVTARYRPGRESALLGGDFYDVVEADDGTVHTLIGDVAGHGPDEAALGVCLRIAWRTLVLGGVSGPPLMAQLQRILLAERAHSRVFATVCSLALERDGRTARVMRAGHPGVLVQCGGTVELAEPACCPALGVGWSDWAEDHLAVPQGGALVLFTDGLFEGRLVGSRARLGEDGLLRLARRCAELSDDAFVDALLRAVEGVTGTGGLTDDIAVVYLRWKDSA